MRCLNVIVYCTNRNDLNDFAAAVDAFYFDAASLPHCVACGQALHSAGVAATTLLLLLLLLLLLHPTDGDGGKGPSLVEYGDISCRCSSCNLWASRCDNFIGKTASVNEFHFLFIFYQVGKDCI